MILVDVYIPAVDETFDFMLDENTSVDKIMLEIIEMITKKTRSEKVQELEAFILFDTREKKQLQANRSLYEQGVRDGHSLMLV